MEEGIKVGNPWDENIARRGSQGLINSVCFVVYIIYDLLRVNRFFILRKLS